MRLFETLPSDIQAALVAASQAAFMRAIYRYPAIQRAGCDNATRADVVAGLKAAAAVLDAPELEDFAKMFARRRGQTAIAFGATRTNSAGAPSYSAIAAASVSLT